MERLDVLDKISDLLDAMCRGCEERAAMYQKYGENHYAKVDGHCNRQCPIGQQLQELGRQLKCGERNIIREDEWEDGNE